MEELDFNFQSILPYIIEALTSVYGKEYYPIISKRINSAVIVPYYDIDGLNNYIAYVKRCKSREYSLKFLERIGIDVQKYKRERYIERLDVEIEKIIDCYIGSSECGFDEDCDYYSPLYAFSHDNSKYPEKSLENKIKLINYLLGSDHEQITKENFDSFSKTTEYLELLKKINEINMVYEELFLDYSEWALQLLPYEKYIEHDKKRKEIVLKEKKNEVFEIVLQALPAPIKSIISWKTLEEQQEIVLGSDDISYKSNIESFCSKQMDMLKSSDIGLREKFWIVFSQSQYLKKLGLITGNEQMLNCDSEEELNEYLNFLNQENIRKYIPSDEVISHITSVRRKKYEEALKEYLITRDDFIDIMNKFGRNNSDLFYNQIGNKSICILTQGATVNDRFVSIMFYTIKKHFEGALAYALIHECGHIVDQPASGKCGFEFFSGFSPENCKKNPYDNAFRRYEKFNETLNDIFVLEAVNYLQRRGIYLIEPKEFTLPDTSNHNTTQITKNLLYPLLQKFRKQVIRAKINADALELIKYIGEYNFEDLVDAVNKVDYLSKNGVVPKINSNPDDPMVIEYLKEVERVKQIYINIDLYYKNNFGNLEDSKSESSKHR